MIDGTHLSFVVLGNGLGGLGLLLVLISLVADEHEEVVLDLSGEDLLGGLMVEVDQEGKGGAGHELGDGLNIGQVGGQVVAALVELLEHDNGVAADLEEENTRKNYIKILHKNLKTKKHLQN